MGFFANMAAKSEIKLRDQVLTCFSDFSKELDMEISTGNVLLPCHIISEVHNGFYVQYEDLTIGVYRCQNHWWLHELDDEVIEGLRSPTSEKWLKELSKYSPVDGGDMAYGIPAFASSILSMLKTQAEEAANELELQQKQEEFEETSRLKKYEEVTQNLNNAAALLWDSGCEMRVRTSQSTESELPDYVLSFDLFFQRVRGAVPLYLYANMSSNSWFLADPQVPDAELVSLSPIDSSSKVTAMNILQLIVEQGLANADHSVGQKMWAEYIDRQFLPRMTDGIIPELLTHSTHLLKAAVQKSLEAIIDSYENHPVVNYSLPALKALRKI